MAITTRKIFRVFSNFGALCVHGKVLVPCGFCYETGLQCFEISSSWGPPMWPRWRTRVFIFQVQYFVRRAKESEGGPFVIYKALF